jgi:hypothetical protein
MTFKIIKFINLRENIKIFILRIYVLKIMLKQNFLFIYQILFRTNLSLLLIQ